MTEPLPLDSPKWSQLRQCYGNATDTPALLQALMQLPPDTKPAPRDEPFGALWSSLCHQGDVFTASYAAVPHLVRAAATASPVLAANALCLAAAIAVQRREARAPAIPTDLAVAFEHALTKEVPLVVARLIAFQWDNVTARSLLAAVAVSKGHLGVADLLMDACRACPSCGEVINVTELFELSPD